MLPEQNRLSVLSLLLTSVATLAIVASFATHMTLRQRFEPGDLYSVSRPTDGMPTAYVVAGRIRDAARYGAGVLTLMALVLAGRAAVRREPPNWWLPAGALAGLVSAILWPIILVGLIYHWTAG